MITGGDFMITGGDFMITGGDFTKFIDKNGYKEGGLSLLNEDLRKKIENYRKNLSRKFVSINNRQIKSRVSGGNLYISEKIDGFLYTLIFDGKDTIIVDNEKILFDLPVLNDITNILKNKKIEFLIAPCELYSTLKKGDKSDIYNIINSLLSGENIEKLSIAIFDIFEIDEKKYLVEPYSKIYDFCSNNFPKTGRFHYVNTVKGFSGGDVENYYLKWVEEEQKEGVIVRNIDNPIIFKVKPKFHIDGVVVGYSEDNNENRGKVKTLLVALMNSDQSFKIVGKIGLIPEEIGIELYKKFQNILCSANFIETNRKGIAFQMVRPEIIIEFSCNDIVTEVAGRKFETNTIIYKDEQYSRVSISKGVKVVSPSFERVRGDKKVEFDHIKIDQISDKIYFPKDQDGDKNYKHSEILVREVYKKEQKSKFMVQKFLVWKTNKGADRKYPNFVFHHTDFSSSRKDPLKRDVKVSNNEEQIMALFEQFKAKKIKKGWELVDDQLVK